MNPKDPNTPDEQRGRIPESLIDSALDGELCDEMSDEIARALRYDKQRRAELLETTEAIRALRDDDAPAPDFQLSVLNALDSHDRFIPRTMRRAVRYGRVGLAAGFLLALMGVAILQSLHPRLATLGAQDTPVHDVASAIERDAHEIVEQVEPAIETARTRFSPLESLMGAARPSRSMNMTLAADEHTIGSGDLSMHLRDHEARRVSIIGRAPSGADGPAPILVSFMSADSVWLFAAPSSQDAPLKHDEDRALPELP